MAAELPTHIAINFPALILPVFWTTAFGLSAFWQLGVLREARKDKKAAKQHTPLDPLEMTVVENDVRRGWLLLAVHVSMIIAGLMSITAILAGFILNRSPLALVTTSLFIGIAVMLGLISYNARRTRRAILRILRKESEGSTP